MSVAIKKLVDHLGLAGLSHHHVIVPTEDPTIREDMEAYGFVDNKALMSEWKEKRLQVHASWEDLQDWMVKFNVHLKRDTQHSYYLWTNGFIGCAERLFVRLPSTQVVFEVRPQSPDLILVVLSATSSDDKFARWYRERLSFRDPATQRQDLLPGQVPRGSNSLHNEEADDECRFIRLQCTDAALVARLRPGMEVSGVVVQLVGVAATEAQRGTHLVRIVEIASVRESARV